MRFGTEPTAEVAGAILAHTVRLGPKLVFKKGRVLTADDANTMLAAGHDSVLVARLEPDDVGEDLAATRVAEALAGPCLTIEPARTGRANIFASVSGVLEVDETRLFAANTVDETITIATLKPYCRVGPGDMVATAKIIPFAVSDGDLTRLEASVGAATTLAVRPFRTHRVGLVLTTTPGTAQTVTERASSSLSARIQRLGSTVGAELRVQHDPDEVAGAYQQLLDTGCTMILALGASAIIDRRDVIPSAVIAVGGEIVHFGMPVDPGNLLLVARVGSVPVIGVPGCARSLKASGFDIVLERLCAGVDVDSGAIMALGAGGLLKEIASRPAPRRVAAVASAVTRPRVAALVLAAGQSKRMGARNKLVAEIDGKPMVASAIEAATNAVDGPVIVVTGHEREQVEAVAAPFDVTLVHNPDYARGMSTSLAAGIHALGDADDAAGCDALVVCLGDMPWVRAEHIDALIGAFGVAEGAAICVPSYRGKRGNPVLWGRQFWPEMATIEGDVGARGLLQANIDSVRVVEVGDAGIIVDVDTELAFARIAQSTPK